MFPDLHSGYNRKMEQTRVLCEVLASIGELQFDRSSGSCLSALAAPGIDLVFEAKLYSMLALSEYYRGDFGAALLAAERAVALAQESKNTGALLFALPANLLATAGFPPTEDRAPGEASGLFERTWEIRQSLAELPVEERMIAGHFFAESAFASGRLDEAAAALDLIEPVMDTPLATPGAVNPMIYFFLAMPSRLAFFRGRVGEALEIITPVSEYAAANDDRIGILVCAGVMAMIAGQRADRARVRELTAQVIAGVPHPDGHLGRAFYMLCAYGYSAAGDLARAAEIIELGCGTPELAQLQTGDRALGYEVLASAALEAGDMERAAEWGELLVPLGAHPAAAASVARVLGRLELAQGDSLSSAEYAEVSVARARLGGCYLEESMGELLRARSLAGSGARDRAIGGLTAVAHSAEEYGILAIRQAAARELRRLGRRLPPSAMAGWTGLSQRERQIALLAAEGYTNRIIARTLFLSERTVQAHMSRVLAALGVPSRTAIPRQVASLGLRNVLPIAAELTPRQRETAHLVAEGASNHEIAAALGISVKTVEKHIGEVFLRWGVSSRTGIASVIVAASAPLAE